MKKLNMNKAVSDSTRLASPSVEAIEEIQEMMRKRGGHQEEEPLQINTTKMERLRKVFVTLN